MGKTTEYKLPSGDVVLLDMEDYFKILPYKWRVSKHYNKKYARAIINGKEVLMHKFIIGNGSSKHTHHKNGDGLDNRKSNLSSTDCATHLKKHSGRRNKSTQFYESKKMLNGIYSKPYWAQNIILHRIFVLKTTATSLSKIINVTPATIRNWEEGVCAPPVNKYHEILKLKNVPDRKA